MNPLPLSDLLADLLERYAFTERTRQKIPVGWAVQTLSAAGADQELILDVLDSSFFNKQEPWTTTAGLAFLLADIAALIEMWFESAMDSPTTSSFPAKRIDEGINSYIVAIHSLTGAGRGRDAELPPGRQLSLSERKLKDSQERIRRSF